MKSRTLSCALLALLAVLLTACEKPAENRVDPAVLGRYSCQSARMGDMALSSGEKWIELKENGRASLFLTMEEDGAVWTMEDTVFTLTLGGKEVGEGQLKDGTLTLTLMGMDCVFTQDPPLGQAPAPEPAAPDPEYAVLACYNDLYYVEYPTAVFSPSPEELVDLTSADGTEACLSRMDNGYYVQQCLVDFDQRVAQSADGQCEGGEILTASGYTGRWLVYPDENGWRSEIIIPFEENKGTASTPMFAAYLYFSGGTREAVWNEAVQGIAASLRFSPQPPVS